MNGHMRPRRAGHEKSRNGCLTCKYDYLYDHLASNSHGLGFEESNVMKPSHIAGGAQSLAASAKGRLYANSGSFMINPSAGRPLQTCSWRSLSLRRSTTRMNVVHFITSRTAPHPYSQGLWMLVFGKTWSLASLRHITLSGIRLCPSAL